jgi:hypothetical protein
VVRTERCFADDQHSLEEFPRLAVLPLVSIHVAQIVENLPHIGVIRTERLLADDQGALEELPGPISEGRCRCDQQASRSRAAL